VSVAVVIPAFNEESRIARVLTSLPASVSHAVVVDDASTDRTGDVVRSIAEPRVTYIRSEHNGGVGRAIAKGYETLLRSSATVFVVMAGDGQMNPADLRALLAPIESGHADYVKGERFSHHEIKNRMPKDRYWAGRVLSHMTSLATGTRVTDSQCGYTAISRVACAQLDLDGLWPRYGYPNDVLGQLAVRGLRVHEVPVEPVYTADLESKLRAHHVPGVLYVIGRSYLRRSLKRAALRPERVQ
jgi:glycosyltransferase involved in cell wall biosynthesis